MSVRVLAGSFSIGMYLALMIGGCASQESAVVATIGGDRVTLGEFNAMFAKNNGGTEALQKATKEEKEKFLDLYVKFRLKVKEAYARGYQNDSDVRSELQEYRENLAVTYLIDKVLTAPALRQLYARHLIELRASHILLQVSSNASPFDTMKTYSIAMRILDSLKMGKSFEELALNNSQDPSVSNNKGDLYYFTSGSMVPEFEDAVIDQQAGTVIPYPVRTQFGYHIIKVTDRHPNPGSIHVEHIMKRLTPSTTHEDSAKAYKELEQVLDSLKHGGVFSDLAKNVSDDKYSAARGGDLGFIDRRRTVQEFDDAAFKLNVGEVSSIVKTQYGLHLITVTEKKPVPPFEAMEPELKKFYQQYKFQKEYDSFVEAAKKEYGFAQSGGGVEAWKASLDTTKTTSDPGWDSSFSHKTRKTILFTLGGHGITIDSVIRLAKANQELRGLPLSDPATLATIFGKVSKGLVTEHKAESMESNYPEFAKIMKEYEQGVMLFKAEQTEVWNKVTMNDSAMHRYFDANRSKFTWPDRVNVQEVFVPTDSVAKVVTFLIKKQNLPFDSVAAQYNSRLATKEKRGEWGMQPTTTNALTQRAWTMKEGEVSDAFAFEGGYSVVKVLEKDPARDKTFAEGGSELSSAFQEYESRRLENEWYESLKKKYPVVMEGTELLGAPEPSSKKASQ